MRARATIVLSLVLAISTGAAARGQDPDGPAKSKSAAPVKAKGPADEGKAKAKSKTKRKTKKDKPSVAQRELAKPAAGVAFDATPLGEALDALRGLCKANVFLDPGGLEAAGVKRDAPVTVAEDAKATVKSVLAKVLADAGKAERTAKLTFLTTGNFVLVSTADRAEALAESLRKDAHRGLSDADLAVLGLTLPDVKFAGVRVADVFDMAGDATGAPVEANWQRLEAAGVAQDHRVTMHLRDVTVAQFLRLVLEDAGPEKPVAFVVINGKIQVSALEGVLDGLETQVEELDNVAKAKASLKKKPK